MVPGGLSGEKGGREAAAQGLTGKKAQKLALFVAEYLIDFNATRAAIRCGYAENSAHVTGCRLLKDPWVKRELKRAAKERKKALRLTVEKLDEELAKLAFANMLDYIDVTSGHPVLDWSQLTRDQAAAIGEITSEVYVEPVDDDSEPAEELEAQPQGGALQRKRRETINVKRTKFKLHRKTKALELVGKRLKAYTDKVEHEGKLTVVVDL